MGTNFIRDSRDVNDYEQLDRRDFRSTDKLILSELNSLKNKVDGLGQSQITTVTKLDIFIPLFTDFIDKSATRLSCIEDNLISPGDKEKLETEVVELKVAVEYHKTLVNWVAGIVATLVSAGLVYLFTTSL